jgi:transposase-like protein
MAVPKNATPAQIINRLRKAEVQLANGESVKEVCKGLGISEQTYYRRRREYGGMTTAQAKKLKELEKENQRLRRANGGHAGCWGRFDSLGDGSRR